MMPGAPLKIAPWLSRFRKQSYSATYRIQLQGLMHGRSRDSGRYETVADFKVGLIGAPAGLEIDRWDAAARPYLAAFQSEDHPPAGTTPQAPELRDFTPMAGYYPFAETGFLTLLADGSASARLWLNIAGDFRKKPLELPDGRWELNPPDLDPSPPAPIVVVAVGRNRPAPNADFVWDYLLTFLSKDEALIMTAGRQVRPATASGRAWRI